MESTRPDGTTVVIPALNEEEGLGATLEELAAVAPDLPQPVEVIIVDDGSRDRTAEIAAEHGCRVIRHPANAGYGASLKTGIRAASYERIAITDADGTYPVTALPAMFEELERFDLVVGARTGPRYRRRAFLSPMRNVFLLLTNFVVGTWIPDPNSGLRVFRRSTALALLHALPRAFSFTTTMTLLMTLQGRFIHFHPVDYRARLGRRKIRPVRDTLRMAQTLAEVILRFNPLKLFLLLGLLPFLLAPLVWLAAPPGADWIAGAIFVGAAFVIWGLGFLAAVPGREQDAG
ncbi:MAG: glycosyltransferase family 2 protein [Pseudomonadota bacterium]